MALVSLDSILVDAARFSPRGETVDEEHVARLVTALDHGETLPPLRLARPEDREAGWYGVPQAWKQQQIAAWIGRQRRSPWASLPARPEGVLYDGHYLYWVLREAGIKAAEVVYDETPVADELAVLELALQANARNAKSLSDEDFRRTFTRLWLGRELHETHEKWRPTLAGRNLAALAQRLGRSEGWVSKMQQYVRVWYALRVELGLTKSYTLARLDAEQWRGFVMNGEALRLHVLLDEHLAARTQVATVVEMTCKDLERLIQARLAGRVEPEVKAPGEGDEPPGPEEPPTEGDYYQGELPGVDCWERFNEPLRGLSQVAAKLHPDVAYQQLLALNPIYAELVMTHEQLRLAARRGGHKV